MNGPNERDEHETFPSTAPPQVYGCRQAAKERVARLQELGPIEAGALRSSRLLSETEGPIAPDAQKRPTSRTVPKAATAAMPHD